MLKCERSHFNHAIKIRFVMKAKKHITIKDVAAHCGVSYQTVSRVINNSDNVRPETRQRIEEAITALNYRPSLAARSLPGRRSYVIGLIIPYRPDYLIRDPNLLANISGIDIEASRRGYTLLLATTGEAMEGINAYRRFTEHKVADGVIVIETASNPAGNKMLTAQGYPHVTLGYHPQNANAYIVHNDDFSGGQQATAYLLQQGHQRIGVINGPPTGAVSAQDGRISGYRHTLQEADLPFDQTLIVNGDYTRQSGEQATHQLLSLSQPPTAIFALNDRMAMGAIHTLHQANLQVPRDVAVIGFDDIPAAVDFNPPLTTINQASYHVGQAATQMLFKLINDESITNREMVLTPKLVVRQSA